MTGEGAGSSEALFLEHVELHQFPGAVFRGDAELCAVLVAALVHVAPVSHRASHPPPEQGDWLDVMYANVSVLEALSTHR